MSATEEEIKELLDEENLEPEFDLDAALDGTESFDLTGKITDDVAKEKATERGWKEEGVDKYGHRISAVEFLERTPFFKKMDLMRGDIDRATNQMKKLARDNQKIAQKSIEDREKLVADFKLEKERIMSGEFIDEAGIKDLKVLDEKIESATEAAPVSEADQQVVSDYDEAKVEFKKNNEWYDSNRAMTVLADKVGTDFATDYLNKYGELPPPEETFTHTLREVKKDFPDLDKPKRQTRVNPTNTRTVSQKRNAGKKTFGDLPEGVREAAKMIMASTGDTEEEYLSKYSFDN